MSLVLLDNGPLGEISHPNVAPDVMERLTLFFSKGYDVRISEVSDYEIRKELIREGLTESVERLDLLKRDFGYVPITTKAMLIAAELWARERNAGRPGASEDALDADVIIAAQAAVLNDDGEDVIVVTNNPKHFKNLVEVSDWDSLA